MNEQDNERDANGNIVLQPKIVISEGKEEKRLFPRLLNVMGKADLSSELQFHECKGKGNLENFLYNLRGLTGFPQVTSIGIVLDSDGKPKGFQPSLEKAQNALKSVQFPVPVEAGKPVELSGKRSVIWIMPDNHDLGELEDLCLKALSQHNLMPCVDRIQECVKAISQIKKLAKPRLYTLLAWLDPPCRGLAEISNTEMTGWDLTVFKPFVDCFFSQL